MARTKYESFVSPKGTAKFPHLNTPDTKWKEEGEYRTELAVPAAEGAAFAARIDKAIADAVLSFSKEKNKKLKPSDDKPYKVDESTGEYIFKVKMRASGVSKKNGETWTKKLPLFDAKGNPVQAKIGGGSLIRCSGELGPYFTPLQGGKVGVTLYLTAVQVLELREWGNRDASGYGFEVEDGFENDTTADASEAAEPAEEKADAAEEEDADGADF